MKIWLDRLAAVYVSLNLDKIGLLSGLSSKSNLWTKESFSIGICLRRGWTAKDNAPNTQQVIVWFYVSGALPTKTEPSSEFPS